MPKRPEQEFLPHREFLRDFLLLKLSTPLSDTLYSLGASRIEYYPYQFRPVLRFLKSPEQRLLIADEVGLGKTIEAALIYRELSARRDLKRVMIVCPAGLREKWRGELRYRFDEEFQVLDTDAFRRFLRDHKLRDGTRLRGIGSLEMLRRSEFQEELRNQAVHFDLVIIDEAHHLRRSRTQSFAIGEILANQSHACVFLSATPLQTGNEDLFTLLRLINPADYSTFAEFAERIRPNEFINRASRLISQGKFPEALHELQAIETTLFGKTYPRHPRYQIVVKDLQRESLPTNEEIVRIQRDLLELNTLARVFNRTRKRDVDENTAERSPFTIEVELSTEERTFYDAVDGFVRWQHSQRQGDNNTPIFTVIMRERQAASCMQALKTQFENSLTSSRLELDLEMSDPDVRDEDTESRWLQWRSTVEQDRITTLLALCKELGEQDTKYDCFRQALRQLHEEDPDCKVLVFSFFRGTVQYLFDRLSREGFVAETIHGGVAPAERQRRIDEFRERDDVRIMVSTEVGAEGLDFEFCSAMFNYDLPWNPMRIEQRIGRIDRYGQQNKRIRIYNMVIADTIETRIFERLYDRIGLFKSSIGDLEPILGEVVSDLSRDIFMARLTPEEESLRAEEAVRTLEWRRQMQEELEKERGLFLGQDALLQREMEQIRSSGRFVSAEEVYALVETFLQDAFPNVRLQPDSADDPSFALYPRPELIEHLHKRTRQGNLETNSQFMRRLESERLVPITFYAETARQRRHIEFVTLHHPLAQVAVKYFKDKENRPAPKTKLWSKGNHEIPPGDYAFFIYQFNVTSVLPQRILTPILVPIDDVNPHPFQVETFLTEVTKDQDAAAPDVDCERSHFSDLEQAVQRLAAKIRYDTEQSEKQNNDALIDERIAGLQRHFDANISNAQRQLDAVSEPRIKLMRQSEIRNLESARAERIEQEESKRIVRVEYTMVASGLLKAL